MGTEWIPVIRFESTPVNGNGASGRNPYRKFARGCAAKRAYAEPDQRAPSAPASLTAERRGSGTVATSGWVRERAHRTHCEHFCWGQFGGRSRILSDSTVSRVSDLLAFFKIRPYSESLSSSTPAASTNITGLYINHLQPYSRELRAIWGHHQRREAPSIPIFRPQFAHLMTADRCDPPPPPPPPHVTTSRGGPTVARGYHENHGARVAPWRYRREILDAALRHGVRNVRVFGPIGAGRIIKRATSTSSSTCNTSATRSRTLPATRMPAATRSLPNGCGPLRIKRTGSSP